MGRSRVGLAQFSQNYVFHGKFCIWTVLEYSIFPKYSHTLLFTIYLP